MYTPKLEKDIRCPLEYGLEVFGGKWKSRIICVLGQQQVLRYSALKKEMVNITDAVLAAALKELIADGIVARKQYPEIPPKVEYYLSEKGKSVLPILIGIGTLSCARSAIIISDGSKLAQTNLGDALKFIAARQAYTMKIHSDF